MEIKLKSNLRTYLFNNLQKDNEDTFLQLKLNEKSDSGSFSLFKIEEDLAEIIRDWAINKQQVVGFDEEYELTSEGEILQEIINEFYA